MTTRRESALAALAGTIAAALPSATVLRNAVDTVEAPAGGLVILRDGTLGEPDVTLGVRHYSWQAEASLELYAVDPDEAVRRAALDALIAGAVTAIEGNRQLGGLVDWAEGYPTEISHEHTDSAPAVARGVVAVTLHYQTTTAQG